MADHSDRPTDEEILQYERQIKEEHVGKDPLVGEITTFEQLEAEYSEYLNIHVKCLNFNHESSLENSDQFKQKIVYLKENFKGIVNIKKDGNCFYRGFAYRFTELVRNKKDQPQGKSLLENAKNTKSILAETGYDMELLEDFFEPFWDALTGKVPLLEIYNVNYLSDTIVCYLRILTAAVLKKDRMLYENFILGEYATLEEFLRINVEPMNVESDQIHIVALSNAFGIKIRVGNLDNTPGKELNYHDIAPWVENPLLISMTLLYRPGHYDCLIE